ncbi:phage holin [Bacillus mojavensis]
MDAIQEQLINLLMALIVGFIGFATKAVYSYLNKKGVVAQIQAHKQIVDIAVNAIEQTCKELGGKEKLELAKAEVVKLAKTKGIKISEKDLDMLVEASVKEMNKVIKENKK